MIIYCDGACNKNTNNEGWGSVVDDENKDLLSLNKKLLGDMKLEDKNLPKENRTIISCKFEDVKQQQNNGAELLSFVASLRIGIKNFQDSDINIIYTDSDLLYKWWSLGKINKKTLESMDSNKKLYLEECYRLRKEYEQRGGKIEKIKGDDNKADLGWHRKKYIKK
jgi:ribonuclease HI